MINRRLCSVFASFLIALCLLAGFLPDGFSPAGATLSSDALQAPTATFRTISGPPGSGVFGRAITSLPNGNFVVSDHSFDDGAVQDVGAVYLYDGFSLALISTLKGSTAGDQVGSGGITVLSDGSFVVSSTLWDAPGGAVDAGAVTWCEGSADTGRCDGVVSAAGPGANSLVGGTTNDRVGAVTALGGGSYLVSTNGWDAPGLAADVGAVTFCPAGGCTGTISAAGQAANSLVGGTAGDHVSSIARLSNGSYVVTSPEWDAPGPVVDAGAVTWCPASGCRGVVSPANSLVGSSTGDQVGLGSITALKSGDYLVTTGLWDGPGPVKDVGAVTWCPGSPAPGGGTGGCTGTISASGPAANSLVGQTAGDTAGWLYPDPSGGVQVGVEELATGSYIVKSPSWDIPGKSVDAGAVTFCSTPGGCRGTISASNSLIGNSTNDQVGSNPHMGLPNGSYVVSTPTWDSPGGLVDAGAVTWCYMFGGCQGIIAGSGRFANSLVGSSAGDRVGEKITAVPYSNYVVSSPDWDAPGPVVDAGAVTWCNGSEWGEGGLGGCIGVIAGSGPAANSLVGGSAGDHLGEVTALPGSAYVVSTPSWDAPGPVVDVGAVTWCQGSDGPVERVCRGTISAENSLVGSTAGDMVGSFSPSLPGDNGVTVLSNGHYVVRSTYWDAPGPVKDVGAVSWCNGNGRNRCTGVITVHNSLVGSTAGDVVGSGGITPLYNGNYVVSSPAWTDPSPAGGRGAVTWCNGSTYGFGCREQILAESVYANSLVGTSTGTGTSYVTALSNGNYVVSTPGWDAPGQVENVGAVTWCPGYTVAWYSSGCHGWVPVTGSLVGSTAGDQVGVASALSNGNYIVRSSAWDSPSVADAGAITLAAGNAPSPAGAVSAGNSITGGVSGGEMVTVFDAVNDQLLVGMAAENRVVVLKQAHSTIQSGEWSAPNTWDYGAPVARSDAHVQGGYTVSLSAPAAIQNLTLTRGLVSLGSYPLEVERSLSVVGTPGIERMVAADGSGALRKRFTGTGSFTFPVGDQTGTPQYSPFSVSLTGGSFAPEAYVAVRVINAKHPRITLQNTIQRYWSVTQNGISGVTYDAALAFDAADVVGNEADLRCMKFDDPHWLDPWLIGGPVDTGGHNCSFTGLAGFSDFTAGEGLLEPIEQVLFHPLVRK